MRKSKLVLLLLIIGNCAFGQSDEAKYSDTFSNFYNVNVSLMMEEFEREHIPLDGAAVSMIPFRVDELFGFVNKADGSWIVPPRFEEVFAVYADGAIVKDTFGYGAIDNAGKTKVPCYFNEFLKESELYHGMFTSTDTTLPEAYGSFIVNYYFTDSGKYLFGTQAHDMRTFTEKDTLAWFRYGTMYSVYGKSGKLHQQFRWSRDTAFIGVCDNFLVWAIDKVSYLEYYALDIFGEEKFRIRGGFLAEEVHQLGPNLFAFCSAMRGGVRFSDAKGNEKHYSMGFASYKEVCDAFISPYLALSDSLVAVLDDSTGRFGLIDRNGKFLVPMAYEFIDRFQNGYAACWKIQKGREFGFISAKGEELFPFIPVDGIQDLRHIIGKPITFCNGLAIVSEGWSRPIPHNDGFIESSDREHCAFFIDKTGKRALDLKCKYYLVSSFSDGLAAVSDENGNLGFINTTGALVIPMEYAATAVGGYPFVYLEIPEFKNGYAYIKADKAYIDKTGKKYFQGTCKPDHYNFSH